MNCNWNKLDPWWNNLYLAGCCYYYYFSLEENCRENIFIFWGEFIKFSVFDLNFDGEDSFFIALEAKIRYSRGFSSNYIQRIFSFLLSLILIIE